MRTITITRFGDPDVLQAAEAPVPGPGELSIDVECAAVGLVDVLFRRGALAEAVPYEPPFVPGLEVAGRVREVGAGVSGFAAGDRVVTLSRMTLGGYAEVAVSAQDLAIRLPNDAGDAAMAVAALPNATTGYLALTRVAHLAAGERVLVVGALGALASVMPPVARALGAGTIVGSVRRPSQVDAALELGYDEVIVTGDDPASALRGHSPFDIIVDPVGGSLRTAALDALAPLGRLLAVGHAASEPDHPVATDGLWLSNRAILGFNVGALLAEAPDAARPAVAMVIELLAAGAFQLPIQHLPLADAARAHTLLESGGVGGRLVLDA